MPTPADAVGANETTGKIPCGFDHCVQSIWDIFATRLNTGVMLLDYGCDVPTSFPSFHARHLPGLAPRSNAMARQTGVRDQRQCRRNPSSAR
jgi:hypothetical protein